MPANFGQILSRLGSPQQLGKKGPFFTCMDINFGLKCRIGGPIGLCIACDEHESLILLSFSFCHVANYISSSKGMKLGACIIFRCIYGTRFMKLLSCLLLHDKAYIGLSLKCNYLIAVGKMRKTGSRSIWKY